MYVCMYIYIYIVTILLPVTVSTIYTKKSCTKNLAKIRHKNATCASHFFIFAQLVATWRGLQGGIIACEKRKQLQGVPPVCLCS